MEENAAIFYLNSQNGLDGWIEEIKDNPDFTELGTFKSVRDLYDELNYHGFTDVEITQMTNARYGRCLDIANYELEYVAFIGQR